MDAARREEREERVQLAVADERLAADDRDVQRAVLVDELEHAVDERLALEVAHLAQRQVAAEMIVAVRVAARAVQRTLARDLDRQRRRDSRRGSGPRPR